MPVVKVKTRGQVTIPGTLRSQLNLHEGDVLDVQVQDGRVVMHPIRLVSRELPHAEELESEYAAMAQDAPREKEALEWSEALMSDCQNA